MLDQAQRLRQMVAGAKDNVHKAQIITVTSGKGGVGKSNFVVNLSIELSKLGKKVLIFDADIGMANDDVLMGFLPKYNIFDVMMNNKELKDIILTGPYGVKLIAGGSGIAKLDELTQHQRDSFINKLTLLDDLDYIIIDTGAGINRSVLGFIACCEELIVITTPEPTSLTDSYSLLKAVNHFKLKSNAKVIINRTLHDKEGIDTFNKFNNAVSNFLKMKIEFLGNISEDRRLVQAVREQKPFVLSYPNCDAARDINYIANILANEVNSESKLGNAQGLFRKMFSLFT